MTISAGFSAALGAAVRFTHKRHSLLIFPPSVNHSFLKQLPPRRVNPPYYKSTQESI
jgi:hypothetical protein